jgi:cell division protein FtsQ
MWFRRDRGGRRAANVRRRARREPLLMVNARIVEQRTRRLQKALTVVLVLAAAGGTIWLAVHGVGYLGRRFFTENDQFLIRDVQISSDGKLTPGLIREYTRVREHQNLFGINLDEIRRSLETIPVVSRADVYRRLPGTLVIRVSERTPLARLGDDARSYLAADREGHVLGPSSRSPTLPVLTGIPDAGLRPGSVLLGPLAMDGLQVLDVCDTTQLGETLHVVRVDAAHPEFLELRLREGARVRLGRDRIPWRLEQLAEMIRKSDQRGLHMESANLTVDRNFPATYRERGGGAP